MPLGDLLRMNLDRYHWRMTDEPPPTAAPGYLIVRSRPSEKAEWAEPITIELDMPHESQGALLRWLADSTSRRGADVGELRPSDTPVQAPALALTLAPAIDRTSMRELGKEAIAAAGSGGVGSAGGDSPGVKSSAAEDFAAEVFARQIEQNELVMERLEELRQKALRRPQGLDALQVFVEVDRLFGPPPRTALGWYFQLDIPGVGTVDVSAARVGPASVYDTLMDLCLSGFEPYGPIRLFEIVDAEIVDDHIDETLEVSYNSEITGERPVSPKATKQGGMAEHEPTSEEIVDSVIEQIQRVADPLARIVLGDELSKSLMPAVYEQMMDDAAEFRADGGSWKEIGQRLDVTASAAQNRLDPDARRRNAERARERRQGGST